MAGVIAAWSGVDPTTTVDVTGSATNVSGTAQTAGSVTTTGGYRLQVVVFGVRAAASSTPPAGFTERADVNSTGVSGVGVSLVDRSRPTPGATGTAVATASVAGVGAHVTIGLRPLTVTAVDKYSFGAVLDSTGTTVIERTLSLPGGVMVTKRATGDVWSYPNIHGDVQAVANSSGVKQGATLTYDPYGATVAGVSTIMSGTSITAGSVNTPKAWITNPAWHR